MAVWFIVEQMESTADWRRGKAEEFPDDHRNLEAADELERLAKEINELAGSEVYQRVETLDEAATNDDSYDLVEWLSEELRAIGFRTCYSNGTEFLENYHDKLQGIIQERNEDELDDNVAVPDLAAQVENDPAVKAAKQAYDEARAKAYAEARKRL